MWAFKRMHEEYNRKGTRYLILLIWTVNLGCFSPFIQFPDSLTQQLIRLLWVKQKKTKKNKRGWKQKMKLLGSFSRMDLFVCCSSFPIYSWKLYCVHFQLYKRLSKQALRHAIEMSGKKWYAIANKYSLPVPSNKHKGQQSVREAQSQKSTI